jgi:hypothetical protein
MWGAIGYVHVWIANQNKPVKRGITFLVCRGIFSVLFCTFLVKKLFVIFANFK